MYSFGDFNILLILLIYNSNIKYTFLKKAKDPDFAARACVCVCVCHGCSDHSNLEMEAECLTKTLSYLNLNFSRTKNGRNNL